MDEGIDSKNDNKKKAVSPKIGLKVDDKGRLNAVKEDEDEEKEEAEPEKVAENEGLSMVLSLQGESAILWYSPSVDITDKVIKELEK